ncbi:MAG: tRNA 2-thiouridine(34) synthase MnmA, partial [Alphaproteobacteria bacterium]|nr:tRNA 2-thiouridine(34) synthase MnmA [Alphaproteobacteria bacterium]
MAVTDLEHTLGLLPVIDLALPHENGGKNDTRGGAKDTKCPDTNRKDTKCGARVIVAMSGGVDSSVAAALVKRAGYEVAGITLQLYDYGAAQNSKEKRKGACCAGQDIHDARRVAAKLDIPHYVLDYESRFKENVIEDFADAYLAGQTPIPCVRCNETVKFRDLLQTARSLGAAALVTGHYIETRKQNNKWEMHRPVDETRDQSYFLFSTTQEQLDFLRFPLARFTKDEIRRFATQLGLPVADKPDSQDICFAPDGNYAAAIKRLRPDCNVPGEIVDMAGNVLGQHQGVLHYTVGQRRGLGIGGGEPLYVVRLDAARRQVVVGARADLDASIMMLEGVNWLGEEN